MYWSRDHAGATGKLIVAIDGLESRGFSVNHQRHEIGQLGPHDENLAIDTVWIGPPNAKKLLLSTSGVHGVEGFAGSAIQLSQIADLKAPSDIPEDTAIAFVHVMNPWGMAWLRRVNESNVDLNRNFLKKGEEYSGEPQGYAKLSPLLNIKKYPKPLEPFILKAYLYTLKNGYNKTKQAFAEGQYRRPKGLQFGGFKLEKGPQMLLNWLEENLTHVEQCNCIDLHTGLGKSGKDTLLVDIDVNSPRFTQLKQRFGEKITGLDSGSGVAYSVRGGIHCGVEDRFPNIEWAGITQEFGTIKPFPLIKALRAENCITWWSELTPQQLLIHKSRQKLLSAFRVDELKWERSLIDNGKRLFNLALADLQTQNEGKTR